MATVLQSLALLAISAGAIKTIQDKCVVSRVDAKELLQTCYDQICAAINVWPEDKKRMRETTAQISQALETWSNTEYTITQRNRTAVLLIVCNRSLTDLYESVVTKVPRQALRPVLDTLRALWLIEGKDGALFSVHEESAAMVEQLNEILREMKNEIDKTKSQSMGRGAKRARRGTVVDRKGRSQVLRK